MGKHENRRRIWLVTPILFFVLTTIFMGGMSLRAKDSADKFSVPTRTSDAIVLRYDEPSLLDQVLSKFPEGTLFVRFISAAGQEVEAKVVAASANPDETVAGAVVRVQYVQAHPTTARLLRGAPDAREDARFYGGLALLSLLIVAALTAIEVFSRRRRHRT